MSKKICLVSSQYLPHVGGVENYVYNLSRELASRGHEVTIITSYIEGTEAYEKSGNIEIYRLPSLQLMNGRFPVLKNNKETKRVKKELLKKHFDLMLVNMRFYFISLWALKLAKKAGWRAIMLDHGSSHLNTGSWLTTKMSQVFEHYITWREKRYCKEFAGVGKTTLEWIKHFGINSSLILNNAVDLEKFEEYKSVQGRDFRKEYGIGENDTVISFVGRLTVEKGVRELVNVMKRVNESRGDVYCILAGAGYLEQELSPIKSKNTIFAGQLPTSDIVSLLCQSDIFCLPSYSEGFPTCVIEACVCNTFIITTERGDAKEIVTDKEHGIILPDADENGLYEAIMSVLDEKEYRKRATELCYDRVINNYTWKHTADKLLSLIK